MVAGVDVASITSAACSGVATAGVNMGGASEFLVNDSSLIKLSA